MLKKERKREMEKFYLEKPSMKRKNDIMEYINELAEYNSETNGIGSLRKIFDGYTFEQALQRCLNMENKEYAEKVLEELDNNGIRAELDERQEKIGYKIREAQLQKIPYMLIIGDKEVEANGWRKCARILIQNCS